MWSWTLDVSLSSDRDIENLMYSYKLLTGFPVERVDNELKGKCNNPSDLEGQRGLHFHFKSAHLK